MAKCSQCGVEILHVRDDFTGASFPIDVEPAKVDGFVLLPAKEGERSPRAARQTVEVYTPHEQTCEQTSADLQGDPE